MSTTTVYELQDRIDQRLEDSGWRCSGVRDGLLVLRRREGAGTEIAGQRDEAASALATLIRDDDGIKGALEEVTAIAFE